MSVELDLAVDEALFGRTHEARKRHDWQAISGHYAHECTHCGQVARSPKHVSTPCQSQPPAYSSDSRDCARVKQRLHAARVPFVIDWHPNPWVTVSLAPTWEWRRPNDFEGSIEEEADSEERALCEFALTCHESGLLGAPQPTPKENPT